ncbi:MAG TPA: hypothetical protein VF898_10475 [Chloroflexota bacterium]
MWNDDGGDDGLDRELQDLGPLMMRQHEVERAVPDPAFTAQLRQRLTGETETRPHRLRFPRLVPIFGAAAVLAAVAIIFLVRQPGGQSKPVPAATWRPPIPSSPDLTKSYPLMGGLGGGGSGNPTVSRIELPNGSPYPGRLRLTGTPSSGPAAVSAYRLAGPAFDAPRVAALGRAAGLNGAVTHISNYESLGAQRRMTLWNVVSRGGMPSRLPLKSIAVSRRSGQLIYHDFSLPGDRSPARPPVPAEALAAARAWLARLGWPASRMGAIGPSVLAAPPGVTQVVLDWPGVGPADTPAAIIWVAAGNRIAEALILPPVSAVTVIRAVSSSAAWQRVARGGYPIGVANMIVARPPDGRGRLETTRVNYVFEATPRGLYLVPVYRFGGTARFPGVSGSRLWFALVPVTAR